MDFTLDFSFATFAQVRGSHEVFMAHAVRPAIDSPQVYALGTDEEAVLRRVRALPARARNAWLARLDDPLRAVRVSALVALVNIAEGPLSPDDAKRFGRVSDEYAVQADLHEDDAISQSDLGLVRLLNGQFEAAARALSISLDLQPDLVKPAFLLGLTRAGQGRLDDARTWLRRVPSSSPYYAAAQDRLKALASR